MVGVAGDEDRGDGLVGFFLGLEEGEEGAEGGGGGENGVGLRFDCCWGWVGGCEGVKSDVGWEGGGDLVDAGCCHGGGGVGVYEEDVDLGVVGSHCLGQS